MKKSIEKNRSNEAIIQFVTKTILRSPNDRKTTQTMKGKNLNSLTKLNKKKWSRKFHLSDRENDRNDEQINTKIIDVVKAGALPVKAKQKTGKMCPMWKRQEKGTMRPNVLTNEQNTTHEKKQLQLQMNTQPAKHQNYTT